MSIQLSAAQHEQTGVQLKSRFAPSVRTRFVLHDAPYFRVGTSAEEAACRLTTPPVQKPNHEEDRIDLTRITRVCQIFKQQIPLFFCTFKYNPLASPPSS